MDEYVVGIDPGFSGAISIFSKGGKLIEVLDVPSVKTKTSRRPDLSFFIQFFEGMRQQEKDQKAKYRVIVEETLAFPSWCSNPQANWHLGYFKGLFDSMLKIYGITNHFVLPYTWQSFYGFKDKLKGIKKGRGQAIKDFSYEVASSSYPEAQLLTKRGKRLDGRADSILIGNYGLNVIFK